MAAIIAQRNILVHQYDEIDLELVWSETILGLDDLIREIDLVLEGAPEC